jgi:hypothetical protein
MFKINSILHQLTNVPLRRGGGGGVKVLCSHNVWFSGDATLARQEPTKDTEREREKELKPLSNYNQCLGKAKN